MSADSSASDHRRLRRHLSRRAVGALFVLVGLLLASVAGSVLFVFGVADSSDGPVGMLVDVVGMFACAWLAAKFSLWLWCPQPAPEGIRVPDDLAPRFRHRLDWMCRKLGAPRVDEVRISADMNAALVLRPRWGMAGRMRATLLVGMPLIHSLTPAQFAAVVMHELSHLRAQRKPGQAWAAHCRAWWLRVQERIDGDASPLGAVARRLFEPALLRDLQHSLRLSRLDEFEADAWAARLIGSRQLAGALIEVELKGRFLNDSYWCKVVEQAGRRRRPSFRPFRDLQLGMQAGFVRDEALASLDAALAADDASADIDTHPTLQQRLRALQVDRRATRSPPQDAPSAADHYFGPLVPHCASVFDRLWWRTTKRQWRRSHRGASQTAKAASPGAPL